MWLAKRVDGRQALALGIAGLVPAGALTLLLVHQPAIGERRLYPLLRGTLSLTGLCLALAAFVVWACAADRFKRAGLTALAWAGLTAVLCYGPFLESTPRGRLYALELSSGDVTWASSRAGISPVIVENDLVVTDLGDGSLMFLDPATGGERGRKGPAEAGEALAAGAIDPRGVEVAPPPPPVTGTVPDLAIVDGVLHRTGDDARWVRSFPGETVLAVFGAGDTLYAYVSTPPAGDVAGGSVVRLDARTGAVRWQRALPTDMTIGDSGGVALAATDDAVVVAGGELVGALDADGGALRWSHSVVTLGKSRGHALPGAVHWLTADATHVYLSSTPGA